MANILIASPADSDLATVTAVSEAPTMPATNLFTRQPSDVWRATSLANAALTIDRTACADGVRLLWLGYHNGTSAGTIRVRAAASPGDLLSAPDHDRTFNLWPASDLAGWERMHTAVWLSDTALTYDHWRLDIADGSNPESHFQAGRALLCDPYQPTTNIQPGWGIGVVDPSPRSRSYGGQAYPNRRGRWRELRVTLQALGDDAEDELFENIFLLNRTRGSADEVLVIRNIADADRLMDQTVYGVMTELAPIVNRDFRLYEQQVVVEELELP